MRKTEAQSVGRWHDGVDNALRVRDGTASPGMSPKNFLALLSRNPEVSPPLLFGRDFTRLIIQPAFPARICTQIRNKEVCGKTLCRVILLGVRPAPTLCTGLRDRLGWHRKLGVRRGSPERFGAAPKEFVHAPACLGRDPAVAKLPTFRCSSASRDTCIRVRQDDRVVFL